jgi:hypothetical protein
MAIQAMYTRATGSMTKLMEKASISMQVQEPFMRATGLRIGKKAMALKAGLMVPNMKEALSRD